MSLVGTARRAVDDLFAGEVASWVYPTLRVLLAGICLVRHSDLFAPHVFLQHHLWVHGLDFLWSVEEPPALTAPLVAGLGLSPVVNDALVYVRTALAVLLLLGIRSRIAALLLALVGYTLMAADTYRYFHHLHLLYLSIGWLCLAPLDCRWSLERAWVRWRRGLPDPPPKTQPIWPLQLIRGCLLSVYFGAALSKMSPEWLRGDTLEVLEQLHILRGPAWSALRTVLAPAAVAQLTLATEIALPVALMVPTTRRFGVAAALAFHGLIGISVMVSTFGVQMAALLVAFVPRTRGDAVARCALRPAEATLGGGP